MPAQTSPANNPTFGAQSQFIPYYGSNTNMVLSTTTFDAPSQFTLVPNVTNMANLNNGLVYSDIVDTNINTNFDASAKATSNFFSQLTTQALASQTGYPQVITLTTNQTATGAYESKYATLELDDLTVKLNKNDNVQFQHTDFRAKIAYKNQGAGLRLDGISAATRGSVIGGLYAAASATPYGAYSIFNINGNKYFGAGIGDHSNPNAIINDFTMRSHVATHWNKKKNAWRPTFYPNEQIIPFRGDRVTVIDFAKNRKEQNAYAWNPVTNLLLESDAGKVLGAAGVGLTQDFIKFYFTGPKLYNGYNGEEGDDIMVFRAIITNLGDSFQANWNPVQMIGRADPNYQYTGFSRDLSLDFTVIATDRDEVKPIWRKLNALAGYTAPIYDQSTIALKAPWMRITIGDLFRQQPAILTSVSYTLQDSDTTWEINIEQDPTMKQVPHKISVSCQFTIVSDYLPQNGGKFYTLADKFNKDTGTPLEGDHNWLSDFGDNEQVVRQKKEKQAEMEKPGTARNRNTNQQGATGEVITVNEKEFFEKNAVAIKQLQDLIKDLKR
jgi:hypothetical protein